MSMALLRLLQESLMFVSLNDTLSLAMPTGFAFLWVLFFVKVAGTFQF